MRYLTVGFLLALTLFLAPSVAAEDPTKVEFDSNVVVEAVVDILDLLKAALAEIGAGIEPNGAPEAESNDAIEEPEPIPAEIGAGIDPNG